MVESEQIFAERSAWRIARIFVVSLHKKRSPENPADDSFLCSYPILIWRC